MLTTITITALPTTRTDGSSVTPADLASANVYKNGGTTAYAAIAGPLSAGMTWSDSVAAANGDTYDVTIVDAQGLEGVTSNNYVVALAVPPNAPLSAATISGATA